MEGSENLEPRVSLDHPTCSEGIAEQLPDQMICPIIPMGSPILNKAIDFTICDINSADDVRQAMKTISDAHKALSPEAPKRKTSARQEQTLSPKRQTLTRLEQTLPPKRQITRPDQNRQRRGRPKGVMKKAHIRTEDFYAGKLSNYVKFRK